MGIGILEVGFQEAPDQILHLIPPVGGEVPSGIRSWMGAKPLCSGVAIVIMETDSRRLLQHWEADVVELDVLEEVLELARTAIMQQGEGKLPHAVEAA